MQMGRVTVEAMKREFGSDPRDMLAAIGPSISGAHYEVSWDVARHFDPEFRPLEYPDRGLPAEEEKYMLDLWGVNRKILMDAGIPEENIQLPNLCTFENADIMFSHRASHGKRGNLPVKVWKQFGQAVTKVLIRREHHLHRKTQVLPCELTECYRIL